MNMTKPKLSRYFLKAVAWRIIASTVTMMVLYAATGKIKVMVVYSVFEIALKIVLYIGHEKLWDFLKPLSS